jgi:hypothetical protein
VRGTGIGGASLALAALLREAPLSGPPPLAVVGCTGRRRRERRGVLALPLGAGTVLVLEARGPEGPWVAVTVVAVAVVAHPGVGGDGADGEPDETGGAAEHPVVLVMVVQEQVVV